MKTITLSILIIMLLLGGSSCSYERRSIYMSFYGDDIRSVRNIVVKNDLMAYTDTSLMRIGLPRQYILPKREFDELAQGINAINHSSIEKYDQGILITIYKESKITQRILVKNENISELKRVIDTEITNDSVKTQITAWIKIVSRSLHSLRVFRKN